MPALWAYARDLFQTPGFGDTIDFTQTKQHYYLVHKNLNPSGIVPTARTCPAGCTPHHREELGGRPFGDGTPPGPPLPSRSRSRRSPVPPPVQNRVAARPAAH